MFVDHLFFSAVNNLFIFFPHFQLDCSSFFIFVRYVFILWILIVNYMFDKYFYLTLLFVFEFNFLNGVFEEDFIFL